MRVLGVDTGYGRCGWGIVEDRDNSNGLKMVRCGVVETSATLPFPQRLRGIQVAILQLLQDFKVNCLAVEKPVHGPNVTNSVEVGAAFGAVLLAGEEMSIPIRIYWPSQVKAAVCRGDAKKREVQMRVKIILGLSEIPRPDDAADALAVAICGANRWVMDGIERE